MGHMKLTLKIQGYTSVILLTVADIVSSDIVLGEDWLVRNPGVIDTPRKIIRLVCGRKSVTLVCSQSWAGRLRNPPIL